MAEVFERAVEAILVDEGGEEAENDPSRAGARFGVSAERIGILKEDLTKELAICFYAELWTAAGCEERSPALGYYLLDLSLRFSPEVAQKWLRLALGLDQLAGKGQVEAKLAQISTRDLILLMEVFVRRRLKSDPRWEECKHWWTNRANRARDRAVKWSREA
jgi:lysozyme family protein